MSRLLLLFTLTLTIGCATAVDARYDLTYAGGRVEHQTDPKSLQLMPYEPEAAYVTLADIHLSMRQQTAFGDMPNEERIDAELRARAAKLGAHAVILVRYGRRGMSTFSNSELQGSGRAIRYL